MIVIRIGQLADQLGVHRNTIRNWVKSGKLPARSMSGKRYLITEAEFGKLCQEFGIDRSSLKLKYVPGAPVTTREVGVLEENVRPIGRRSERLLDTSQWGDVCLTCGSCASACPVSGVDGFDPRKAVRMAVLGLDEQLVASQWPWKCTLCGKCEEACPMNVEIVALLHRVRGLRSDPGCRAPCTKGCSCALKKATTWAFPERLRVPAQRGFPRTS